MLIRKHTSYSIASILLLIVGIVFGGLLISFQKASEVLIPFQSNGSGEILSSPIADAPLTLPKKNISETLTSNVATQNRQQWYTAFANKAKERNEQDVSGQEITVTQVQWTGKTVCNGQPLSGVYVDNGVTGADGLFTVSANNIAVFYHPDYGVVTRNRQYHSFSGDINFCNTQPANSKVDSRYFINPDTLEVKMSARVYDTDTSPAIGWEDEYVYLQCWTWSGKWDLRLNDWKKVNTGKDDLISLFKLEPSKRNYFVCRAYTYDQGQYAGPEWMTNGGGDPIQSFVPVISPAATLTKLPENLDTCTSVRAKGGRYDLENILKVEKTDTSILNYCSSNYPLLWESGPVQFPLTEEGCGQYFAHMTNVVTPYLNARNIPYTERSAMRESQLRISSSYHTSCMNDYNYMIAGPLQIAEPSLTVCSRIYFDLYENTYSETPQSDQALFVKKRFRYDPNILQQCATTFPQEWKPFITPAPLLCSRAIAFSELGMLDEKLVDLGANMWGKQHVLESCKKSFPDIMYEQSDFEYTEPQCHQIAEWQFAGVLESQMAAKGYKGNKAEVCKELYPSFFEPAHLTKVKQFRDTGVVESTHVKMTLMPQNRTALSNPVRFIDNLEKVYLTYADMVGGKPYGGRQIPLEERCPYRGDAFVSVKTAECPNGTMSFGWKRCDGVESNGTCSTGYRYDQAWGLASGLAGDGSIVPTQIIESGMKNTVLKFNQAPNVMSFGLAHEFGHNFDGIAVAPQYNFGAGASVEALANIKLIHMMDRIGMHVDFNGTIYTSTQHFLDGYYTPLYQEYLSRNDMDFFKMMEVNPATGLRTTYSSVVGPLSDYNLMVIQKKAEKIGIQKLFDTLAFYNQFTPSSLTSTDSSRIRRIPDNQIRNRMEQFVFFLSAHGKMDLSIDFINDKYPVSDATKAKIAQYLGLTSAKQTPANMIRLDHGLPAL